MGSSWVRWLVLAAYGLLAAATQLLWLTFAPITTQTARALHTDEGSVGDLAIIFPLVYIVLALPFGRLLDARFRPALTAGAILTGAGGVLRALAPTSFGMQLAGQVLVSIAQPLVLNSITKVAADYFPAEQRATAISLGTVALFGGILAAVLGGGPLFAAGGLPLLLWVQAAIGVLAAVAMIGALRSSSPLIGEVAAKPPEGARGWRWLLEDRFMWSLAALVFLGMGIYNAVATWLEAIIDHFGHGPAAGGLIALMTFGGVLGAAVLPPLVAARDRRRLLLTTALVATAVGFGLLEVRQDVAWYAAILFVVGFLVMACLPVVLDWSEVHTAGARQGEATGFLLLAGNLGGVVLALAVQPLLGSPYAALVVIAITAAIGVPVALRLPVTVGVVNPLGAVSR